MVTQERFVNLCGIVTYGNTNPPTTNLYEVKAELVRGGNIHRIIPANSPQEAETKLASKLPMLINTITCNGIVARNANHEQPQEFFRAHPVQGRRLAAALNDTAILPMATVMRAGYDAYGKTRKAETQAKKAKVANLAAFMAGWELAARKVARTAPKTKRTRKSKAALAS